MDESEACDDDSLTRHGCDMCAAAAPEPNGAVPAPFVENASLSLQLVEATLHCRTVWPLAAWWKRQGRFSHSQRCLDLYLEAARFPGSCFSQDQELSAAVRLFRLWPVTGDSLAISIRGWCFRMLCAGTWRRALSVPASPPLIWQPLSRLNINALL